MKCEKCDWHTEVHGMIFELKTSEMPDHVTYICGYPDNVIVNYNSPDKVKRECSDINKDRKCEWFRAVQ